MPTCQAEFGRRGVLERCPKTVEEGKTYCRWHDPDDESWREIYARLRNATPEEKTDIVLGLIEEHPEHELVLPMRDGESAVLWEIDLSRETLDKRRNQSAAEEPPWWDEDDGGAYLSYANLQGAILNSSDLQGADLEEANLKGAHLENANLQDADLMEANLQGAYLMDANLQDADLMKANLRNAILGGANLQNARLESADLQDTGLSVANLQGTNLINANLQAAYLRGANLQGARLSDANLQGANLQKARLQSVDLSVVENIRNVYLGGAWLDRTRMQRKQLGDGIAEEKDREYEAAKYAYLALKQNFDDLGDYEAASWAYRKERRMEKLEAKEKGRIALQTYEEGEEGPVPKKRNWREAASSYFKFFSDTFVEWLCDYGESVWRVVGWMAALLFVVGPLLFGGLGGIDWDDELRREYFSLPSPLQRLWFWYYHYLLYTLDTFTTASFSGLRPANDAVKVASGFFAIAGIVLAGLLGFVAGNRIRRS